MGRGGRKLSGDSTTSTLSRVNPRLLDPPSLEPVPPPLSAPAVVPPVDGNQSTPGDSNSTQGEKGDEGNKGDESAPPAVVPPSPPPDFVPPTAPPSAPPPLPQGLELNATGGTKADPVEDFAKKKADRDAEIARIQAANAANKRNFGIRTKLKSA